MSIVRQAAAIPYRETKHGYEVLLVTRASGGWGVPKGTIKKGHSPLRTASLESLEEAGVLGVVGETSLGSYAYRKGGKRHEVRIFALRVERILDRWEEEVSRMRVWVRIAEAARLVQKRPLERALTQLRHELLIETAPATIRLAA